MAYAFAEQSRHKLGRAQHFIDEVAGYVKDFQNSKPAKLVYDAKTNPREVVVKAEIQSLPPTAVCLAIGDAIHNMRSALDILICDHVRRGGMEPTPQVAYPFCAEQAKLEQTIASRGLKVLSAEALDAIRDSKPYKGGNDVLVAIHDLDIGDKHKLLLPSIQTTMLKDLNVYAVGAPGGLRNVGGLVVREGVGFFGFPIGAPVYFTADLDLEVNLFIEGYPHPIAVEKQLTEMLDVVTKLVDDLSR